MSNEEHELSDAQILRLRAEDKLIAKQKKTEQPNSEIEVKRLLHELQVHQIELEMQNEELLLANQTAERALKKYTLLYDFAPMGYFTLDSNGGIHDLNFTGAEILGHRRFSLVNCNFKLFVSDDSKPVFNRFLDKVFAGNVKESCEIMLGYNNDHLFDVYIEGILIGDEANCLLSVVDISKFRKTEVRSRKTEETSGSGLPS